MKNKMNEDLSAIPIISVIMLTYNREALVPRAIDSVLTQSFRDFEFIIVDNGSSDRSGAIADDLRRRLAEHRNEFVNSDYILDFEKEWTEEYARDRTAQSRSP